MKVFNSFSSDKSQKYFFLLVKNSIQSLKTYKNEQKKKHDGFENNNQEDDDDIKQWKTIRIKDRMPRCVLLLQNFFSSPSFVYIR